MNNKSILETLVPEVIPTLQQLWTQQDRVPLCNFIELLYLVCAKEFPGYENLLHNEILFLTDILCQQELLDSPNPELQRQGKQLQISRKTLFHTIH